MYIGLLHPISFEEKFLLKTNKSKSTENYAMMKNNE